MGSLNFGGSCMMTCLRLTGSSKQRISNAADEEIPFCKPLDSHHTLMSTLSSLHPIKKAANIFFASSCTLPSSPKEEDFCAPTTMATPPQFRPQKWWFYSGRWTKSHDVAFINALCWKAEKGFTQDNPRCPNKNALLFAGRAVTRMSILHNPDFEWDRENNIVHAPFADWVALIRRNPFANAYLKHGEPKWDSQKLIFEWNQTGGRANENEIVIISSGKSDDDSYMRMTRTQLRRKSNQIQTRSSIWPHQNLTELGSLCWGRS
ncbi:hypothetical protein Salat_1852300 [Sesamum alatum]|uniref:Uncharacterized protein n=1 Tax=Sesamum alatum TaxID=300844 RepID=A0AAE1Y426_9LAMI|nr:hypothetical protein Salat_1852300 [Sesamum alatum]